MSQRHENFQADKLTVETIFARNPATGETTKIAAQNILTLDQNTGISSDPRLSRLKSKIAVDRLYGTSQAAGIAATMHMMLRAPAHFDYIQLIARGPNSGANTIKAGVAAPAQFGDGQTPLDAAGSAILPTAVTWGTTDPNDFTNPGGGSATGQITNSSGTETGHDYVEGQLYSDWIYLPSLARVDTPSAPPLYMVRLYGANGVPSVQVANSNPANANPFTNALPEFRSGYWGTDQTSANTGTVVASGWFPSVEVRFLLRNARAYVIGFFGDSLDQGDQPGTAAPWGGTINGWARKFVTALNNSVPASLYQCAKTGQWSQSYHNRAIQAIKSKRITHAFLRPWSVNEGGLGAAGVTAALNRTNQILALAEQYGVLVTLIKPGAMGPANESLAATVRTYCDQAAIAGVPVIDIGSVTTAYPSLSTIKPEFVSDVDVLHLNEAGHTAIASYAYTNRSKFGL